MNRGPELLAPAGSPEGVRAAVQNGADAVYMGGTAFNARRRAKNFTEETLEECIRYCHLYGVKVYCTFNILIGDREFEEAARQLCLLQSLGTDALIVQDLGAAALCRRLIPGMPLHASTQMALHDLGGVRKAAELGFSRAVVARELQARDLAYLCRESPIEIETFVHGALCGAVSGQCYMSAVIGRRSGNRGLCAQPCRMEYTPEGSGRKNVPLMSLKDLCMASHLHELADMGIACLKIEGRMRRPEYTGLVTGVYRRALDEGRCPTREETDRLRLMFSRDGFTDGYFTGNTVNKDRPAVSGMYGVKGEAPQRELEELCAAQRRIYEIDCPRRSPVDCVFTAHAGGPLRLTVTDDAGHEASAEASAAEPARNVPTAPERVEQNLRKWGGTPFFAEKAEIRMDGGLAIPMSSVNALRRTCAEALADARQHLPKDTGDVRAAVLPEGFTAGRKAPDAAEPALFIQAETVEQAAACAGYAARTYLPLEVMAERDGWQGLPEPVAVMPRVVHPHQTAEIRGMLEAVRGKGVKAVLTCGLGGLAEARALGFTVYGDFGLNLYNSASARELAGMGFASLTTSFELQWAAVRDLEKPVPTEAVVYGRLPLMVFENCLIRSGLGRCGCGAPRWLTDRTGQKFLLLKGFGCRTRLFNGSPLYLADRRDDYRALGLSAVRLMFTAEAPADCGRIAEAYARGGAPMEEGSTRGLYYRGVE